MKSWEESYISRNDDEQKVILYKRSQVDKERSNNSRQRAAYEVYLTKRSQKNALLTMASSFFSGNLTFLLVAIIYPMNLFFYCLSIIDMFNKIK